MKTTTIKNLAKMKQYSFGDLKNQYNWQQFDICPLEIDNIFNGTKKCYYVVMQLTSEVNKFGRKLHVSENEFLYFSHCGKGKYTLSTNPYIKVT